MTKEQAYQKAKSFNEPLEHTIKGLLRDVEYSVYRGEYSHWFNSSQPPDDAILKEFIKRYGYRIFIRKGNDINGYPLWCIYWGDEENPIPYFNVSSSDIPKIYELK